MTFETRPVFMVLADVTVSGERHALPTFYVVARCEAAARDQALFMIMVGRSPDVIVTMIVHESHTVGPVTQLTD